MASEHIIEEKKQGQALITENLEGNGKKLFIESYGCQMNLNDSEIVHSSWRRIQHHYPSRRSRPGSRQYLLHSRESGTDGSQTIAAV